MRIVGGKYSGYRFTPPRKTPARPTTDIAKEGLFNILNNTFYFDTQKYLDLFGGTGSISYEMSSRGCTDITLVERDRGNILFIEKTVADLKMEGFKILKQDVFKFMQHCNEQYSLIFAGPPYPLKNLADIPELLFKYDLLKPEGWFILEHNPNHNFDDHPYFINKRNYGTTIFSIFEAPAAAESKEEIDEE